MFAMINAYWEYLADVIHHIDYDKSWSKWLVYPICLPFTIPFIMGIAFFMSSLFLQFYRIYHFLLYGCASWREGAQRALAIIWYLHGRVWFGFEVHNIEKIPVEGRALIIFYHGVFPLGLMYTVVKFLIEKKRLVHLVIDRFLFSVPGWGLLTKTMLVTSGSIESGVQILKDDHLLAIAPGGAREAMFSENYSLLWENRVGFAKIALQADAPIIPLFTVNINEACRTVSFRGLFRRLYERFRIPYIPMYGGFPVKLRTVIGDPVYPDEGSTPEQYARKVENAVKELIVTHQRIPGSIFQALLDRFRN